MDFGVLPTLATMLAEETFFDGSVDAFYLEQRREGWFWFLLILIVHLIYFRRIFILPVVAAKNRTAADLRSISWNGGRTRW